MAATGFTPIQLYYSTTAAATPTAGNLADGELALNIQDEKLYFKNASGVVKLLASNATTTNVTTISFGSTGLTPSSATSGAVTVAGTLAITNGGTGQTTANAAFNALAPSQTGNSGKYLTTDGTNTSWATNPLGTVTSVDVSGGTTGLTTSGGPITSSGTITLAGTLATTNGGTGLTSFTANGVVYASSTSALTTGSALTFDGAGNFYVKNTGSAQVTIQSTSAGSAYFQLVPLGGGTGVIYTAAGQLDIKTGDASAMTFGINSSEQMRLTSTGLGIGTSSPAYNLDVRGTGDRNIAVRTQASGNPRLILEAGGADGASLLFDRSSNALRFDISAITGAIYLNTSGNLGLGVTPYAWSSSYYGLDAGNTALYAIKNVSSGGGVSANSFINASNNWIYKTSDFAARYDQQAGRHAWYTAPSGTAGNAITFTQAMTLDASGNLGIGTTSPGAKLDVSGNAIISDNSANAALRITQTGAGNALLVEDSANPDSTPLVVDATGLVVSGHTAPIATVADSGSANNPKIQVMRSDLTTPSMGVYDWSTNAGITPNVIFSKSKSGTIGTRGAVSSGDYLGALVFDGDDGTSFIRGALIRAEVDGTPGTNDMPGRLVFSTTADGASSPTERMRIDSAGNVGIGGSGFAGAMLSNQAPQTGAASTYGITNWGTVQSGVTVQANYYHSAASTAAASFTLSNLRHYLATQGSFGAGSTVTTQSGFYVDSNLTGATNNYGFYSNIASGTGRWNFYAAGTAENYLGGNLKIGATTARGTTAGTNHLSIFNGTAPAGTLTNGITLYSASGDFNFMDSSGNGYKVGFRNIPAVGTKTSAYVLATGDVGKYVQVGTSGSIEIPNATFAEGDVVSIFNNTTGNITITCTITTAYIAGTDADKATMTLATRGVATILFISGTVCVVSGNVT